MLKRLVCLMSICGFLNAASLEVSLMEKYILNLKNDLSDINLTTDLQDKIINKLQEINNHGDIPDKYNLLTCIGKKCYRFDSDVMSVITEDIPVGVIGNYISSSSESDIYADYCKMNKTYGDLMIGPSIIQAYIDSKLILEKKIGNNIHIFIKINDFCEKYTKSKENYIKLYDMHRILTRSPSLSNPYKADGAVFIVSEIDGYNLPIDLKNILLKLPTKYKRLQLLEERAGLYTWGSSKNDIGYFIFNGYAPSYLKEKSMFRKQGVRKYKTVNGAINIVPVYKEIRMDYKVTKWLVK